MKKQDRLNLISDLQKDGKTNDEIVAILVEQSGVKEKTILADLKALSDDGDVSDDGMKIVSKGYELKKSNNGFVCLRQDIPVYRQGKRISKPQHQVYEPTAFKSQHAANLLGSGYHWEIDACPADLPEHFFNHKSFGEYLKAEAKKKEKKSADA